MAARGTLRYTIRLTTRPPVARFSSFKRLLTSLQQPTTKLFINNEFLESRTNQWIDLRNPATNKVISKVPETTTAEMEAAVAAAKETFPAWSRSTILSRQQIMFRLHELISKNLACLTEVLIQEFGKTRSDAERESLRCHEIVKHCCSIPSLHLGESLQNISQDMDIFTFRLPLGVTAGITPFNFPALIPLMAGFPFFLKIVQCDQIILGETLSNDIFALSTMCGNTFVLKTSSYDPGAVMILVELCRESGFPPGVVNVIHGRKEPVTFLCDHPDIKAISFVGSDEAGNYIYERACKNGKRAQCNLGAKNYVVVMPDANKERTLSSLLSGAYGGAGQRCMSVSTAVFVGESKEWISELVEKAKQFKVNGGKLKKVIKTVFES
ncbi:methylmalonate-semialdehyde dehydrogenase [acylating] mitochondrial [Biomphalaria pfeifferi]|uniref:Methylmalonate-semialdehyde dehydrogenase [acylating] mitochondrial n=1 Tax=Biomphalaria pfeifferi TaxID=112525 RepID=A0AAD8F3T8_BIOPF|nr:methylmalonate-semialdehyde dehydrogenase [acylating] mitochondrial [Biomphalaria pfeifferi]